MTNLMFNTLIDLDPDPDGTAPLLSEFIDQLAGAPIEDAQSDETGMVLETITVSLPVECRVEIENGKPAIRMMTPQRTETSIQSVLHRLKVKVERDADF